MYIGIYLHAINYTIFGFDNNCKVFKLFNSHTFLKIIQVIVTLNLKYLTLFLFYFKLFY